VTCDPSGARGAVQFCSTNRCAECQVRWGGRGAGAADGGVTFSPFSEQRHDVANARVLLLLLLLLLLVAAVVATLMRRWRPQPARPLPTPPFLPARAQTTIEFSNFQCIRGLPARFGSASMSIDCFGQNEAALPIGAAPTNEDDFTVTWFEARVCDVVWASFLSGRSRERRRV
jgi:hypothetical protein